VAVNMDLITPKFERAKEGSEFTHFSLSPLEHGFGQTLGNALRRVLLSSLPGAAITSVRITDVMHEFSTIPGVREDVIQVMLQLKQIRMKLHNVESAQLHLDVKGEGTITAADIVCPPEVEIINPSLYLFSISEKDAHVEMDMTVELGRGYLPANDRPERLPIGVLPVDAIFSPVRRVNWDVTSARVGHSTNYDRLSFDIWTDGSINAEKAMKDAATILIQQLSIISGAEEIEVLPAATDNPEEPRISKENIDTPIETLDLSVRVFNALKRTGVTTVGQVIQQLDRGEGNMLNIRNFGEKSLVELKEKLIEKGYLAEEKEVE
jgi:DNA-directed RNA polymerase subunit alpha